MPFSKLPLNQLKITFLVSETYPSFAGGGLNAFHFARYLYRKGAICKIGCLNYNLQLAKTENIEGVQINRIPYFNNKLLLKILSIPLLIAGYIKQIATSDLILIYGKYLPGIWFIIFLAKLFGKCVVFRSTMMREDDLESMINGGFRKLKKHLLKKIDLYFAINSGFKDIAINVLGSDKKIFTSYQGIDSQNILSKNPSASSTSNSTIKILCNGLLVERKGYRGIFEALANSDLNYELTILGQYLPSKYHRSSEQEIHEMEQLFLQGITLLKNRVVFKNTVKNINPYLQNADIFLYGANQDGTPNAVLEAMTAGLPVVMFNNLPDKNVFIPNKTIMTFNQFNEIPLVIEELWQNKEKMFKMANHAAQIMHKNYTFDHVANGLFQQLNCKKIKKY